MMSRTAASTSSRRVRTRPSGNRSSAAARSVVRPSPRAFGRSYSGFRRMPYVRPPLSNTSAASVGVPGSAYFDRSIDASRLMPLGSP